MRGSHKNGESELADKQVHGLRNPPPTEKGVASRNGKNRTLRIMERPQWPKFARLKFARLPDVISRQVDVLPT